MNQKLNCILLIDDDEATNYLHGIIIKTANCATHIKLAINGVEALAYLELAYQNKQPKPDLILLDINMPVMNGWDFLEEYKKIPAEQKSKAVVVMLSTSLNPDDKLRATLIPDISGFKNKPLDDGALRDILNTYFPDNI